MGCRSVKSYSFDERLAFSRGKRELTDIETLKTMIPGCITITKTDVKTDKLGIDYIATLRRGAEILIDAKARDKGASRFWKGEPDLALEKWSVIPDKGITGKVGWTLCEKKQTDMILFTFDPSDTQDVFLMSFQLLRIAFVRNITAWYSRFNHAPQNSFGWRSECVFVPVSVVFNAIMEIQHGKLVGV